MRSLRRRCCQYPCRSNHHQRYEEHAEYRLIKFTFLGDDGTDLKDRQHELNEKSGKNGRIPDVKGDLKVKRLVVRDPFGLNGSFLYENIRLSR